MSHGCRGRGVSDGGHARDGALRGVAGWQPDGARAAGGLRAQDAGGGQSHAGEEVGRGRQHEGQELRQEPRNLQNADSTKTPQTRRGRGRPNNCCTIRI